MISLGVCADRSPEGAQQQSQGIALGIPVGRGKNMGKTPVLFGLLLAGITIVGCGRCCRTGISQRSRGGSTFKAVGGGQSSAAQGWAKRPQGAQGGTGAITPVSGIKKASTGGTQPAPAKAVPVGTGLKKLPPVPTSEANEPIPGGLGGAGGPSFSGVHPMSDASPPGSSPLRAEKPTPQSKPPVVQVTSTEQSPSASNPAATPFPPLPVAITSNEDEGGSPGRTTKGFPERPTHTGARTNDPPMPGEPTEPTSATGGPIPPPPPFPGGN